MKLLIVSSLGVVSLIASTAAFAQIVVVPAHGDVDQTLLVKLDHIARNTLDELGEKQPTTAEVQQAILALGDRPPSTNIEYAELGRELGVPIVMTITASRSDDVITVVARAVRSRDGDATSQLTTVNGDSLIPSVRLLLEAQYVSLSEDWTAIQPPARGVAERGGRARHLHAARPNRDRGPGRLGADAPGPHVRPADLLIPPPTDPWRARRVSMC